MEEHEHIEIRSEEVQEILGTPPKWIVRWGTLVVFIVIGIMGVVSYVIKYPEIITAEIVITTAIPPESVNAQMSGQLSEILVEDRGLVEKDQLVAIMQSPADFDDVQTLEFSVGELQVMDESEILEFSPDRGLMLGSLQGDYSAFITEFESYLFKIKNGFGQQNIQQLYDRIKKLNQNIEIVQLQLNDANEALTLEKQNFNRVKSLYPKVSTKVELENARKAVVDRQIQVKSRSSEIGDIQVQIKRIREEILQIQQNTDEASSNSFVQLKERVNQLKSSIDRWKQRHLIYAPGSGRISFSEIGRKRRFVEAGDEIMAIVPETADSIIGKVKLPMLRSGKVKNDQKVVVKFDSYPFHEYGVLLGEVGSKSLLPKDNLYLVEVKLDKLQNGRLLTTQKHPLIFDQEMKGMAEIITEDRRFITRIFEKFIALFKDYTEEGIRD